MGADTIFGIEGGGAVVGVDDAVFIGKAAGGLDVTLEVAADGHVDADGVVLAVQIGIKGFQQKFLHTADTHPHRSVVARLCFCDNQIGFLQTFDVDGGGGDGNLQDGCDFLDGKSLVFQEIEDIQTCGGGEGFSDESDLLVMGGIAEVQSNVSFTDDLDGGLATGHENTSFPMILLIF